MKNKKNIYIPEHLKESTQEEITKYKQSIKDEMKSVLKTIKDGKIYANIKSISSTGMSRKILFYRVKNGKIENVTAIVAWLNDEKTIGKYVKGKNTYYQDDGITVAGCGMDMTFNTLYNCIPYNQASKWNQQYNRL